MVCEAVNGIKTWFILSHNVNEHFIMLYLMYFHNLFITFNIFTKYEN